MKQNKDEQIRELDIDRVLWKRLFFLFLLGFIAFGILSFVRFEKIQDLKQDLESCQDKVPVNESYSLKYECWSKIFSKSYTIENSFKSYKVYQEALKDTLKRKNCEVLE